METRKPWRAPILSAPFLLMVYCTVCCLWHLRPAILICTLTIHTYTHTSRSHRGGPGGQRGRRRQNHATIVSQVRREGKLKGWIFDEHMVFVGTLGKSEKRPAKRGKRENVENFPFFPFASNARARVYFFSHRQQTDRTNLSVGLLLLCEVGWFSLASPATRRARSLPSFG